MRLSSFSVIACRVWDLYVTHSILTGWWLSRINTYNSSLVCAWIVFLCDLVYIMDAVARTSKTSHASWIYSSLFSFIIDACGLWTILAAVISAMKFVTFVPYHVLVILELDISGLYLVICALRIARLLQSGRLYAHIIWTVSTLLKNGGLVKKTKAKSQSASPKADRVNHLKRTKEKSPFLELIQTIHKIQAEQMELKTR